MSKTQKAKRPLALCLAILMVMTLFVPTVFAADEDFTIEEGVLESYTGSDEIVIIPDTVTAIGEAAFKSNSSIVEVTIPSSVVTISKEAFSGCTKLRTVHFSEGLVTIGESAFASCTSLKSLQLPEGLETIGTKAFASYGAQFKWIEIPSTVTQIGTIGIDAFESNYTSLSKPGKTTGMTDIIVAAGNTAYYDVDGVLYDSDDTIVYAPRGKQGGLEVASGTKEISAHAFWGTQLDYVKLPSGLETIGNYAFAASYVTVTNIPSTVTSFGQNVFYNSALYSIEIEDGVTTIGSNAFTTCYSLKGGFYFPASVTSIGSGAIDDRGSYLGWVRIDNAAAEIPSNMLENFGGLPIYGVAGSTAETYADSKSSFTFSDISSFVDTASVTLTAAGNQTTLELDETIALTADQLPVDATADVLTWFSSDSAIVSVDQAGQITAQKPGTATIYAKTGDNVYGSIVITSEKGAGQSDYIANASGLITGYRGTETDLVIPETVGVIAVVGIADGAFQDNRDITSAVIPGHVKTVGSSAFAGCIALETVEMQSGVNSIGEAAFEKCTYLIDISVPESVNAIGASAFAGCTALKEIALPGALTTIESGLLSNCSDLEEVTMGNLVTEIKASAFASCRKLTGITLSTGLTKIGASAFSATGLTALTVPEGVTDIGNDAFGSCSSLVSISFPSTLATTGGTYFKHMFEQNENGKVDHLKTITIAAGNANYKSIDGLVYSADGTTLLYCPRGRTEATIAEGVTRIEDYAFFICFDLETVYMPSTLQEIGHDAFHYCEALTYCVLPDGLKYIDNAAFFGCELWEDVIIPASVEYIGPFAFCECAATTIVVPEGISRIETFAFWGYEESLEYIKLPSTLTYIGPSAFSWAKNLVYFVVPDGVTEIGYSALGRCDGLTYVTFPDGLETIGEKVFIASANQATNPYALEGVYIPSTATDIHADAISGYTNADIMILSDSASSDAAQFASDNGFQFAVLNLDKSGLGDLAIWVDGFNRLVDTGDTDPVLTASMTDLTDSIPQSVITAIAEANAEAEILAYFDLTVEKSVGGAAASPVTGSGDPLRLIMDIPASAIEEDGSYYLVEVDPETGNVTLLDTTRYVNTVHGDTSSYLAYALIYVAEAEAPPSGNIGSGGASSYTVKFDSQGGSEVASLTVKSGEAATQPADPVRDGYTFTGWYTDADCTQAYDFTAKVTKGLTLYAGWQETGTDPGGSDQNPFTDVAATDWFYEDVMYVYENGLMNGTSTTLFRPALEMTRGMMVTILYRMEGEPDIGGLETPFPDVEADQWYTDGVIWASETEIVFGYDDGTFGPEDNITREQFAVILYRYAQYKGVDVSQLADLTGFVDASDVSGFAIDAVRWVVGAQIMQGKSGSALDPLGTATRSEVAAMLHRYASGVGADESDS